MRTRGRRSSRSATEDDEVRALGHHQVHCVGHVGGWNRPTVVNVRQEPDSKALECRRQPRNRERGGWVTPIW